jgi:NADPH-dependent 2,4-dienoyl-CoA reductase/sulfur reductase-like enzyme
MERIVVVGGSLAGLRAAETLRSEGFEGELTLVGAEKHLPYDRPPLSKQVLTGAWEPDRVLLRKPEEMGSIAVDWRLGTPAAGLDLATREVHLADGDSIGFDGLVIATGGAARRLPTNMTADLGPSGPVVMVLRTLDDSLALRQHFARGDARVVVIGAGFIGLEAAAAARGGGNQVTVLEGAPAPLIRGLGAEMGAAVAACHGDHGVEIRCGVQVRSITNEGVVIAVDGSGNEVIPADVVVVGIGVLPCTEWLEGSGLVLDDGVVCDVMLNAGAAGVYAAGDVARWPNALFGEQMRVEHWTNAAEQGAVAAKNLLAERDGTDPVPYAPVPFFWSDQYDRRIQFLGRAHAEDEVRLVVGSVEERQFLALYGRDGRLTGALGLNSPRLVMPYRRLLAERVSWEDALAHAASS